MFTTRRRPRIGRRCRRGAYTGRSTPWRSPVPASTENAGCTRRRRRSCRLPATRRVRISNRLNAAVSSSWFTLRPAPVRRSTNTLPSTSRTKLPVAASTAIGQVPPVHPRVRLPRSRRASSSADRCCEMICQSHRIPLVPHLASFVRWRAESTLRAEWIAVTRDVSLSRVRAEGFRLPSSSLLDRVDAYLAGIGKAHSPVGLFVGAWSLPTVQPTAQVHKRVALM